MAAEDAGAKGGGNPLLGALLEAGPIGLDVIYALLDQDALSPLGAIPRSRLPDLSNHGPEAISRAFGRLQSAGIAIEDVDLRGPEWQPRWYLTESGRRLGDILRERVGGERPLAQAVGFQRRGGERDDLRLIRSAQGLPAGGAAPTDGRSGTTAQAAQSLRVAADEAVEAHAAPSEIPADISYFHPWSPLVALTGRRVAGDSPPGFRLFMALARAGGHSPRPTVGQVGRSVRLRGETRLEHMVHLVRAGLTTLDSTSAKGVGAEPGLTADGLAFAELLESICTTGNDTARQLLAGLGVSGSAPGGNWKRLLEALCFPHLASVLLADPAIGEACGRIAALNESISSRLTANWTLSGEAVTSSAAPVGGPAIPEASAPPARPPAEHPTPAVAEAGSSGSVPAGSGLALPRILALAHNHRAAALLAIMDALLCLTPGDMDALARALRRTGEETATGAVTADVRALQALGVVEPGFDARGVQFAPVCFLTRAGLELARMLEGWGGQAATPPRPRSPGGYAAVAKNNRRPDLRAALATLLALVTAHPEATSTTMGPEIPPAADLDRLVILDRSLAEQIEAPSRTPARFLPEAPLAALSEQHGLPFNVLIVLAHPADFELPPSPTGAGALRAAASAGVALVRSRRTSWPDNVGTEVLKRLHLAGLVDIGPAPAAGPSERHASKRLIDREWSATPHGVLLCDRLSAALAALTDTDGQAFDPNRLRWLGVLNDFGTPTMAGLIRALSIPQLRDVILENSVIREICRPVLEINERLGSEAEIRARSIAWGDSPRRESSSARPSPGPRDLT